MGSFAEYRAIKAVNWSTLKAMDTSPKQYRHALVHESDDAVALRIGRAIHCFVLEPQEARKRLAVFDGKKRGTKDDNDLLGTLFQTSTCRMTHHPSRELVNFLRFVKGNLSIYYNGQA